MRMVFLRRPRKPLAALSTFLCLAWEVTPRLTRAMTESPSRFATLNGFAGNRRSAVRQKVFLDVVAVGFEQHIGAAQLADLLLGALDHAVPLARLCIEDLSGPRHLEALFRARLGLDLGHLALLIMCARPSFPCLPASGVGRDGAGRRSLPIADLCAC